MAETPRTETDLVQAIMEDGGWIAAGETPTADDSDKVKRKYRERLEELRADGLAFWPPAEIPLIVFSGLVFLMVNEVGPAFGTPFNPQADEYARRKLRRVIGRRTSGEATQAEYF